MAQASKKYLNHRLALVHDNKVLFAPKIKEIIKDGQFKLTFQNENKFKYDSSQEKERELNDKINQTETDLKQALDKMDETKKNMEEIIAEKDKILLDLPYI